MMQKVLKKNHPMLVRSSLVAIAMMVLLYRFFQPYWETNDDVSLSMVAHGYGAVAVGTPNLVFSNVLWGYLVRAIPTLYGIYGYSIATLLILLSITTFLFYSLRSLSAGFTQSLLILLLLSARPLLFPQFTINAGLLTLTALLCWQLYLQHNRSWTLLVGCLLLFVGYLIRSNECLLVLVVALPWLPWQALWRQRVMPIIAFTLLALGLICATVLDRHAYQGAEWQPFNAFNPVRLPFTDYNARLELLRHPDLLARHGYTPNDLSLLSNWFFADPTIANPEALRALLTELGPLPTRTHALANVWIGIKTLWHPNLLALSLTALLLGVLRPHWKVAFSWILFMMAIFVLGVLGRPGVLRVYIPLLSLLVLAPFLTSQQTLWRNHIGTLLLLITCLWNTSTVCRESRVAKKSAEQINRNLSSFPSKPVIIWGNTFPFTAVYPVLTPQPDPHRYCLYSLGCFTLAPFSVAFAEQQAERGLIKRLTSPAGVPIVAHGGYLTLLKTYCKTRLHGELKTLSVQKYGALTLNWQHCEIER